MGSDLAEAKRRLRDDMRRRRRALAPEFVRAAGEALVAHWQASPAAAAARVALYAALPDELPTRPLFEVLRAGGCQVLLPRCGDRILDFARVGAWSLLREGRYGLLEPPAELGAEALGPDDAVLVPGVAFDPAGHRLGQGGGWYDRSFPVGSRAPRLIGAGFALQVVEAVPHDSRDRQVDAIVTERGYTRASRS